MSDKITKEEEKRYEVSLGMGVVGGQTVYHVYLNDHRILGGKPPSGGKLLKETSISHSTLLMAIPDLKPDNSDLIKKVDKILCDLIKDMECTEAKQVILMNVKANEILKLLKGEQ